jgi:hypothetical protein
LIHNSWNITEKNNNNNNKTPPSTTTTTNNHHHHHHQQQQQQQQQQEQQQQHSLKQHQVRRLNIIFITVQPVHHFLRPVFETLKRWLPI